MRDSISIRHRLVWLVLCLAAGVAAGMAGAWFSGNLYWYLAIPVALAIGWLRVANPEECIPPDVRQAGKSPGGDGAS